MTIWYSEPSSAKIGAKLGYDAVIASTFEIASDLLQREAFDIMTLDLSLGERDGVELLRLVADCKLHAMPIVIISGCEERILNSTKRVAEGLNLSLTRCLTKPLNLDSLRDALFLPGYGRVDSEQGAAMRRDQPGTDRCRPGSQRIPCRVPAQDRPRQRKGNGGRGARPLALA